MSVHIYAKVLQNTLNLGQVCTLKTGEKWLKDKNKFKIERTKQEVESLK